MVLPPTVPPPPISRRRDTVRALTVLNTRLPPAPTANPTVVTTLTANPPAGARTPVTARATVARLTVPTDSNPRPPRLATVKDPPSGRVPPNLEPPRRLDTTTTSGPSRPPAPTSTPDGASLTTTTSGPSRPP